jgi:peroxiredoxin Q/BCP
MEGHQRNLYLYDRLNARVAGVSRDDALTLKYWADDLGLTFPLLSNVSGYLGYALGALEGGAPMFSRRTVVIDRRGVIRYVRDGSPDFREILLLLKRLQAEEAP